MMASLLRVTFVLTKQQKHLYLQPRTTVFPSIKQFRKNGTVKFPAVKSEEMDADVVFQNDGDRADGLGNSFPLTELCGTHFYRDYTAFVYPVVHCPLYVILGTIQS